MSDYDCGCKSSKIVLSKRCILINPHDSLRKVVKLMEDSVSADLYERHLMILNDFIDASANGLWVKDLPYIIRLLELLIERQSVCLFRKPLEQVLTLCMYPLILTYTSEMITFKRDIQEYFMFLGFSLIKVQDDMLQDLICQVLRKSLKLRNTNKQGCLPLKVCFDAIEDSQFPELLAQLLEVVEESLYEKILNIVLICVDISTSVCFKMVHKNMVDTLLRHLDPLWKIRNMENMPNTFNEHPVQYFGFTSSIVWSLLSAYSTAPEEIRQNYPTPGYQALWTLDYTLRAFCLDSINQLNRNQIMGIILLCIKCFPMLELYKCDLKQDIELLSTATEIGLSGSWAAEIKFLPTELNYEFKKMLLLAICLYSKQPGNCSIIYPKRVIPALLMILDLDAQHEWHSLHLSKLRSLAIHVLQVITPLVLEDFLYYNGPYKLLILLDSLNETCELQLLQECLQMLDSVTNLGGQKILAVISLSEASFIFYAICQVFLLKSVLKLNYQRCLAYSFSILSRLCKFGQICTKQALELSIEFMKRVINPGAHDPVLDPRFLISGIHFIWESILYSQSHSRLFVSMGGVYILLDLLETSCFPVKLVALGVLVDLCFEGSCVPHLITWRKAGKPLLPILLELFREENVKLGVKTTANGTIADIEAPIMGQEQWYETFFENKDPNSSPALIDLLGSSRPRIYAIIHMLNNHHAAQVDIANEHYGLYNTTNLSWKDQATLLLAENFLALKLGEAWVELNRDFNKSGIRPIAVDGEIISHLIRRHYRWASHIQALQEAIRMKDIKIEISKEKKLYITLKESKLEDSLSALRELDFIARTTERMFRLISKMKYTSDLERSLQFSKFTENHTTYMYDIKVNPVYNQEVSIQSNIIIDANKKITEIQPISEESSIKNENVRPYSKDESDTSYIPSP